MYMDFECKQIAHWWRRQRCAMMRASHWHFKAEYHFDTCFVRSGNQCKLWSLWLFLFWKNGRCLWLAWTLQLQALCVYSTYYVVICRYYWSDRWFGYQYQLRENLKLYVQFHYRLDAKSDEIDSQCYLYTMKLRISLSSYILLLVTKKNPDFVDPTPKKLQKNIRDQWVSKMGTNY